MTAQLSHGSDLRGARLPEPGDDPEEYGWVFLEPLPSGGDHLQVLSEALNAANVAVFTDGERDYIPLRAADQLKDALLGVVWAYYPNSELFREEERWNAFLVKALAEAPA